MCSVKNNLAEKWKLNLLTDWLTSFKMCSRFYFANSLLVELKALNIIKSLVISSTRNKTGSNLGWVFCRFFAGFLGWFIQKTHRVFWVSTQVSEPWPGLIILRCIMFQCVVILLHAVSLWHFSPVCCCASFTRWSHSVCTSLHSL